MEIYNDLVSTLGSDAMGYRSVTRFLRPIPHSFSEENPCLDLFIPSQCRNARIVSH
jgi:hypothetical protein